MDRCIVLNGDYTFLNTVSWKRAVCLLIKGKTEVLKYSEKVILHFSRELESSDITKKIELLRGLREKKLSIEEMGLKILGENLKKLNFGSSFDGENVFRLLSEGETEKAFSILSGQQKTLSQLFKSE